MSVRVSEVQWRFELTPSSPPPLTTATTTRHQEHSNYEEQARAPHLLPTVTRRHHHLSKIKFYKETRRLDLPFHLPCSPIYRIARYACVVRSPDQASDCDVLSYTVHTLRQCTFKYIN
ncbi:hypothetical protein KIN20_028571 [Parelaphostrongylus tenuis]|uniref:Uncharacterized protein n=1 Tax=Parelaphostrongylus tenuis TaxID=148309 RepID=A0AAD5WET5_PARTN|nr:hypothetical protein KIN20_028571 [Parelaphostrongylus tenuis]